MSKKPDYEVFVSEKNGDKNYYTRVKLQALPLDGNLVLFPPKEKE
jgi:hypothetical protein